MHTCLWGTVLTYSQTSQTVDVQIIPRRIYSDGNGNRQTERPAPLLGLPVVFPGSGAYSITWPLQVGDWVLIVFTEQALDASLRDGLSDTDPLDERRFALSDGIAIPGLRANTAPIPAAGVDTSAMVISAAAIKLGDSSASDFTIKGTTYRSAEDTLLTAIGAAFTALTDSPAQVTAATTVNTAITTFKTGTYLSSKVKVV